jgi:hypothetical protein
MAELLKNKVSMVEKIIKFLIDNREWIFSGVGITIITVLFSFFNNIRKNNKATPFIIQVSNNTDYQRELKKENHEIENNQAEVYEVVRRFISVYENHGIRKNQIPSFIDKKFGLHLKDFKDDDSILQVLNDELINWTCEKFGIQRKWIDGIDNKIYSNNDYYKQIHKFIEDICKLISKEKKVEIFVFKHGELVPEEDKNHQLVLLIRYPIGNINSKEIYRYVPISTLWNWGYWRSRYQLKSIFYICVKN